MKVTWVVVTVALVLAAFASLAIIQSRPPNDGGSTNYQIAVSNLEHSYKGPTRFAVSAPGDPATRLEPIPGGYIVHGTLESDSPKVLSLSPNGKVQFHSKVMGPKKQYWVFGANTYTLATGDVVIEAAP